MSLINSFPKGGGSGETYTAGDGINIDNNEITVDEMPSVDMVDVMYPLPSTETEEHGMNSNIYYYVDADNGDDNNDGLSTTTAFRTIQRAVNACGDNCVVGETINQVYYYYIRVNTSATNHYEPFRIEGKVIQLFAWNFNNNTSAETSGILYIEPPSSWTNASTAVCLRKALLYFRLSGLVITNTLGGGIDISSDSLIDFGTGTPTFTINLNISCKNNGLTIATNSYLNFRGTVSTNSNININSTNAWGINIVTGGKIITNSNASISGGASGSGACNIDTGGQIIFNGTGASTTNLCNINITSNGTGSAIAVNNMSIFKEFATNANINIKNNSSSTASPVVAQYNSVIFLRSYNVMNIENKSTAANLHVIQSGTGSRVILNTGVAGTPTALIKNISSSTGWCFNVYEGGSINVNGGTANTYPILEGTNGITVTSGGTVTYANIKNNCTGTKQSATTGGHIYTGNQTSIPNY